MRFSTTDITVRVNIATDLTVRAEGAVSLEEGAPSAYSLTEGALSQQIQIQAISVGEGNHYVHGQRSRAVNSDGDGDSNGPVHRH